MIQLKASFNNPVKAEYKEFVDQWITDAKIDPDCMDYSCIGNAWHSNYNYAHIRPEQYDERRERRDRTLEIVKRDPSDYPAEECWHDKNDEYKRESNCATVCSQKVHLQDHPVRTAEDLNRLADELWGEDGPFNAVETDELPF